MGRFYDDPSARVLDATTKVYQRMMKVKFCPVSWFSYCVNYINHELYGYQKQREDKQYFLVLPPEEIKMIKKGVHYVWRGEKYNEEAEY